MHHALPMRQPLTGVVLHGYGGDSTDVAGLAHGLAERLGARITTPDLPGHGTSTEALSLVSAQNALGRLGHDLGQIDFVVGHSLGARLAMLLPARARVLISMPGEPIFSGSRRDMIRVLRPGRVVETEPLSGLVEVLASPLPFSEQPALLLVAAQDLETVRSLADRWTASGVDCETIGATSHRDVIDSPATLERAANWLAPHLR